MKRRPALVLVSILLLALVSISLAAALSPESAVVSITAQYLPTAPASLLDPVWLRIPEVEIPVQGRESLRNERGLVATQAVYTDEDLYLRLRWNDPTRSVIKQSWQFDGTGWRHMEGNEDRIAIVFEITRIEKFASRGCAVLCHSPPDVPRESWKLATQTPAEKGDLWHWKAARSAPYGYADDGWLTVAGNPTGSYRETGRRNDAGDGGDVKNETADGTRPIYTRNPTMPPAVEGFLLKEETVAITDDSIFQPGDVIPYRLPLKPSGSRADVNAESRHADGQWLLMLSRKLDTRHEDDISFNPMKRYSFAMAVFDNSGDDHSKATKALILDFGRK